VGARVLLNAMADVALQRPDERTKAAVALVSEFAMMDGPRRQIVGERSGLSVHYDLGQGDPLLGRRMPDLDLETDAGAATAFDFLHQARPVLFEFADGRTDLTGWSDRVERVTATASAKWELPVLGVVDAPAAVLVRPDGHVAWTGDSRGEGLASALTLWCGEPGLGTSA
jgi:3-(3-hydroxy-phenyl)propionate hydroxylase